MREVFQTDAAAVCCDGGGGGLEVRSETAACVEVRFGGVDGDSAGSRHLGGGGEMSLVGLVVVVVVTFEDTCDGIVR